MSRKQNRAVDIFSDEFDDDIVSNHVRAEVIKATKRAEQARKRTGVKRFRNVKDK